LEISIEDLNRTLIAASFKSYDSRNPSKTLVKLLVKILMRELLLSSLKKIQQMDSLDIEAIYYLWTKIYSFETSCLDTDYHKPQGFEHLDRLSTEEIVVKINQFLVAASSKDCSVMITLFPLTSEVSQKSQEIIYPVISVDNCSYRYRAAIIDLDEKIEENIPYYYQLDQTISRNYYEQEVYKVCVAN